MPLQLRISFDWSCTVSQYASLLTVQAAQLSPIFDVSLGSWLANLLASQIAGVALHCLPPPSSLPTHKNAFCIIFHWHEAPSCIYWRKIWTVFVKQSRQRGFIRAVGCFRVQLAIGKLCIVQLAVFL